MQRGRIEPVDRLTPRQRSENMRKIKSKGTKPELLVRRLVHKLGYRFRLHAADLPGKPDLVFRARKKVIFVHGCFWHAHPSKSCKIRRQPKTNKGYWSPKLLLNQQRDASQVQALRKSGWSVLVLWECDLRNEKRIEKRTVKFLGCKQ